MRIIQICLYLFVPIGCFAQTIELSREEFRWALFHPFAALKVKKISRQLQPIFKSVQFSSQLDSFNSGGKSDAYRHTFYMASFSQKVKVKKLRRLGVAHEKANHRNFRRSKTEEGERADSLAGAMDLQNNELGFAIGSQQPLLSLKELSHRVIEALNNGKGVILKRDYKGRYVNCDGQALNLSLYIGKWFVPKCLVPSNTRYMD